MNWSKIPFWRMLRQVFDTSSHHVKRDLSHKMWASQYAFLLPQYLKKNNGRPSAALLYVYERINDERIQSQQRLWLDVACLISQAPLTVQGSITLTILVLGVHSQENGFNRI